MRFSDEYLKYLKKNLPQIIERPPILKEPRQQQDVIKENAATAVASMQGPWPPVIGDHIAVNFEDGFYIGEVKAIDSRDSDIVTVTYMKPKRIVTAETLIDPRQFWIWPSKEDIFVTDRKCVLPLRPVLEVAVPPSTRRFCVFRLLNFDFIDKFSKI
jgi:adenylate kinase